MHWHLTTLSRKFSCSKYFFHYPCFNLAPLPPLEQQETKAMGGLDFAAAMEALAGLRAPIDGFFEGVQVNSENEIVRRNRLCLLNRIRDVMGRVAAFEALEG